MHGVPTTPRPDQGDRSLAGRCPQPATLNSRFRQATRRRGHFPSEQAAMKVLNLTGLSVARTVPTRHEGSPAGRAS